MLTSLIAQKFFLPQFIYTDVYAKTGDQENEFCDCLLEFESVYKATTSDEIWFEKKVVKKAKKQLKDTFAFFADTANTIMSKNSALVIDRNKTLIPVIVFLNPNLSNY